MFLLQIRDIQIIVAGNVYSPGSYTINGNSNIFHALMLQAAHLNQVHIEVSAY